MSTVNWNDYPLMITSEEMVPFDVSRAERIAERTMQLYNGGKGQTMISVHCQNWKIPQDVPPLNAMQFPQDMEAFLDRTAIRDYYLSREHERIGDDWIHSTRPRYGIAEHSAFLGGKVDFSTDTSYQHQICAELSDFRNLKVERDNVWMKLVVDGMKYLREKWGKYVPVCLRGADGPADLANAVRGNDIFYDVYDDPDELRELLSFCAKASRQYMEWQREQATYISGGCINGNGVWMPGKSMGHISDDLATMLSSEVHEELFMPSMREFVEGYDTVYLHTHSLGHHVLPHYTAIDNIHMYELTSDPNAAKATDVFKQYFDILADKIIFIRVGIEDILALKDYLSESKLILVCTAKDEEEAKRAMDLVEKYR